MTRPIILVAGLFYVATGIFLFLAPQTFYDTTPGVAMMGPFNSHFIRDAGLAFGISGMGLAYGGARHKAEVAVFGAGFPFAHALFHIWIWFGRGLPLDQVAFVNLTGIQLPAWIALLASLHFARKGGQA